MEKGEFNVLKSVSTGFDSGKSTKGQGTGNICLLLRGFVISRFFSIYHCWVKKIACCNAGFDIWRFVISRFNYTLYSNVMQ